MILTSDHRRLLKDDRVKGQSSKTLFVQDDSADRLG